VIKIKTSRNSAGDFRKRILEDDQASLSQYIGDLKNFETYMFFRETYHRFEKLFRFKPDLIVCDEPPDYLSTRFAEELQSIHRDSSLLRVQHHHAHVASGMTDNNINERVIGICYEGTRLGSDGRIWGAEVISVTAV
jgi:hydrogenase maturation protein HypF